MEPTLRSARIVGSVPYTKSSGKQVKIPLGPCLIELMDEHKADIIWGASGQHSTSVSTHDLEAAISSGDVQLLDPAK